MKISILNLGISNIESIRKAISFCGYKKIYVTNKKEKISDSDLIVLPGVGSFPIAMKKLSEIGLVNFLRQQIKSGKDVLGICLGMQLFANISYEFKQTEGLSVLEGKIKEISSHNLISLPHMGWNKVRFKQKDPLFDDLPDETYFYFLHSYFFQVSNKNIILATVKYGTEIPAIIKHKNICGFQFHPEKSQKHGIKILKNYLDNINKKS